MAFFEAEFPKDLGFLSVGGPAFSTTVKEGFSGDEETNRNWLQARRLYTVDLQNKTQAFHDAVQAFFLVLGGRADPFRFFDHRDYKVTGQAIGTGDGSTQAFQLVKTYTSGGRTYTRVITKPITSSVKDYLGSSLTNTVKIYDNGSLQTLTTDYTLDYTTGLVTFVTAPVAAHPITADFQFHVPVRLMADELKAQVEESNVQGGNPIISFPQFELREVKIRL